MLDNQLFTLILDTVNPQLLAAGIPGVPLVQADQPTQQGVFIEAAAYFHKLGDVRRGTPEKLDIYDPVKQVENHTESQVYETMFQVSSLFTQNPANPTQFTASDVLNLIAYTLQSQMTVESFAAQGVGIYRIGDVPNPYFKDDRARFEGSPNLDFTLTHTQTITTTVPVVTTFNFNIEGV